MKHTHLEICQIVASSMDSDEFNSINDSVESQQISEIVRTVYYDMVARAGLPEHREFFQLDASGDNDKPTLMTLPEEVRHIEWLKYDKMEDSETAPKYLLLQYVTPYDMMQILHGYDTDGDDVGTFEHPVGSDTITFPYRNDKHPDYYTLYDDYTLIFDSYQSDVDTTLQSSKTFAYGEKGPTYTLSDSFIPDLDEQQFALLVNEAKILAFAELKQSLHPVADRNSRRQWIAMKKDRHVKDTSYFSKLPDYARRV